MKRIYLDSNVFISLFNREIGKGVRGLFAEAEAFFERVKEKGHVLVLSNLFFEEIERNIYLNKEEVLEHLKKQSLNIEAVGMITGLPWRQFCLKGLHESDALHIAAAIAFKCDCIVTFNIKHFKAFRQVIDVTEPADLN